MKKLITFLTLGLLLIAGPLGSATLEGVSITGVSVNISTPVHHWPLAGDLIDRTGTTTGSTTFAGTNRTYVDSVTGLVTTAGANVPRFESVGGYKAVLIEPAGTNLVTHSHEFRAAISGWLNQNCTITDNAIAAPDGNTTADKIVEANDSGQSHYIRDTIAKESFTDNASVTFSVYLKPAGRTFARIRFRLKDGNYKEAYFNLSTGAMSGTADADSYGSESMGNGWWRYWITHDIGNGANDPMFFVYLAEADNDVIYNGDGSSGIYIWGAMVQESPVPTSLVETSGATATRLTESGYPSFTLPVGLFDDKGTAIVWWRPGFGSSALLGVNSGILSSRDNPMSIIFNNPNLTLEIRGFDGINVTFSALSYVADTWYKLIVKWGYLVAGVEKFRVGVDSGSGVSWGTEGTFDGSYTLGTHIRLGYDLFSRMHLRELYLFPDVLSDAKINDWGGTP
ncbi:hypothetical protein LCGC14_2073520 [marine sediment metagenome]|uniref:Uncharacterized protein n=1 Tax=marine sediment metagenome TaxID=412755 RepID=A0A0F9EHW7_9ZZZZ